MADSKINQPVVNRRTFVGGALAASSLAVLAGCGGGGTQGALGRLGDEELAGLGGVVEGGHGVGGFQRSLHHDERDVVQWGTGTMARKSGGGSSTWCGAA